ncbi:hypothetical protein L2E82_32279 [Cichorium intybus]|uniref:Uncharacterized protein n=1 Tax=Cichorium intybus TaxID=13427 RepID=A0ACB9BGT0_CICIN|nr:hypothetical protein L2E82_32279 [Cichorium intybus]
MEDWLVALYAALQEQAITIPESDTKVRILSKLDECSRLNEDELRRFYDVLDGDFAKFLSSVKKTIQWRRKYNLLSKKELETWDHLVFWHGSDVMQRPSLIIRIGLAGSNLNSDDQEGFVRAVGMHYFLVNFVEYGVVNLVNRENPQLTVLLDCDRLAPFEFPIQTFRSCVETLQDHYPNRLGCLLVVRVPSIAQVMTQTLYQVRLSP